MTECKKEFARLQSIYSLVFDCNLGSLGVGTRSYKKDDEPLLNLTGAMSREGAYVYTKEGRRVPSLNARGFSEYSMNKIGGRRKMLITWANSAR